MEILYISSVPSKSEFFRIKDRIRKNVNVSTYGMNESGFKFHSLILEGLSKNSNQHVLSLVGRSISLNCHKGIIWKTRTETVNSNLIVNHLGLINLPILKQLFLGVSFFCNTLAWLYKNRNNAKKGIIMDAAYVTILPFVLFASSIIKCKKIAIFCDIYEYMGNVKDAREKSRIIHKIVRNRIAKHYKKLDGFVLLTQQMNPVVNKLKKPSIIMEGLVDINMDHMDNGLEKKDNKTIIMYAGALRKQYGLKNLIEGFMDYKNDDALLWIFGAGDYSTEIEKAAKVDRRIVFFGLADNSDIVNMEMKATLLINPRPVDQDFTKYSFPSKNMEYMVSGTPLLTTRMPGMPEEYYNYIYTIDGSTPGDITKALNRVLTKPREELHDKGKTAKQFVLTNKNNVIQAAKIIRLLRDIDG